jgi:hypothetical protein
MSYKNAVLNDHPNSFYLLDEVRSGTVGSYSGIISQFATYQDLKDSGITYSALSGLPIIDYSGNINNGYAISTSSKELMPLVPGSIRGTQVLEQTRVAFSPKGIATKYFNDNSFSIEVWAVLPSYDVDATIVADVDLGIGIFYENGNIVFKVGDIQTSYTVSNSRSKYIVALFENRSISLYIDGVIVDKQPTNNYKFTNQYINFISGTSEEQLIIDSVAFYKFALSQSQINNHYNEGIKEIKYSQIVNLDNGYLFSMNVEPIKPKFKYSYPESKSWREIYGDNVSIADDGSYLYFKKTLDSATSQFSFTDSFIVPNYLNLTTSQIYWEDDVDGILVEVSTNGSNWQECQNGNPLPYFNKNENLFSDLLYLRVTISSADTRKYLPILKSLEILFFSSKNFYSDNSGYYLSSNYDYSLPKKNNRILAYDKNNGLRMYNGHGFYLNNVPSIKTVEMIFTPRYSENVLVSATSKIYEWNQTGTITKSGIASIYVNGIDRTSSTNIWDFISPDLPHHVVITFSSQATNLKFNQNQSDSKSGLGHMYNNLAIYPNELGEYNTLNHYTLYTNRIVNSINDTSLTISESTSGNDSTSVILILIQPEAISI